MEPVELTKEAILGMDDLPLQKFYVDPWNLDIYLRSFSGTEREDFEAEVALLPGNRLIRVKLTIALACDKTGKQLFTRGDCDALQKKSGAALHAITEAGMKHNGMLPGDLDELEKNSESDQSDDSGSD